MDHGLLHLFQKKFYSRVEIVLGQNEQSRFGLKLWNFSEERYKAIRNQLYGENDEQ